MLTTFGTGDVTGTSAWLPIYVSSSHSSWPSSPTANFDQGCREFISHAEMMRRMRQSLAEIKFLTEITPIKKLARQRNPSQGRHGFQQAYRLPGYRSKRPR